MPNIQLELLTPLSLKIVTDQTVISYQMGIQSLTVVDGQWVRTLYYILDWCFCQ